MVRYVMLIVILFASVAFVFAQGDEAEATDAAKSNSLDQHVSMETTRAPAPTENTEANQVVLNIRFADKKTYYPLGSVPILVTVQNKSSDPYVFKLAEDRRYSLNFDARTLSNRPLAPSDDYRRALLVSKPAYYRDIVLNPGEEYSFIEDLSRFVKINVAGSYNIQVKLYPRLVASDTALATASLDENSASNEVTHSSSEGTSDTAMPRTSDTGTPKTNDMGAMSKSSEALTSNMLILTVRPPLLIAPNSEMSAPSEGSDILKPESIPPDEVISTMLTARQKAHWNEFFLYLDIESLATGNESIRRSYVGKSEEERLAILARYKASLRQNVVDSDIVRVPESFEIINTSYNSIFATVRVNEIFDYKSFKMKKEYEYQLKRIDGIWFVVSYTVTNQGSF